MSNIPTTPQSHVDIDNDWLFEIPWDKMPTDVKRKLDNGEHPEKCERLEIKRLIVCEVLAIFPTPPRRHLYAVARKMAMNYPEAFKDKIADDVFASGYNYLTKQLMNKVDNLKRRKTTLTLKGNL